MAALGAGIVRTTLGTYQLAFVASGSVCLVAALLALAIGRGAERAPGVPEIARGETVA